MTTGTDYKKTVDDLIKNNHVMVFSKSYCPYCKAAKQRLKKYGDFKVFELDTDTDSTTVSLSHKSKFVHFLLFFHQRQNQ